MYSPAMKTGVFHGRAAVSPCSRARLLGDVSYPGRRGASPCSQGLVVYGKEPAWEGVKGLGEGGGVDAG